MVKDLHEHPEHLAEYRKNYTNVYPFSDGIFKIVFAEEKDHSLLISLVNASIRPIMQALSLPLTILTLGIFHLVVNGAALLIASWLTTNILHMGVYIDGFGAAFFGSIIISIVAAIVGPIVGADD